MTSSICYPDSTDWTCLPPADVDALDPDMKIRAESLAWSSLAALTGYYFSTCPLTVRPCRKACDQAWATWATAPVTGGGPFFPHIGPQGFWLNSCICGGDPCSCSQICEIVLPGPVGGPVEVTINGALLDPTAYRVDNGNRLVRQDGDCWPDCQDMNAPLGEEDTWSVTYYRGTGPNTLLDYAAGVLAMEFYRACNGDDCRLPDGVTSVTRQGVSFTLAAGLFHDGLTGIREVDAIVGVYNPNGLKAPPYVTSPDVARARVTTYGG